MFKESKLIISSLILGISFILGSFINVYFQTNPNFDVIKTLQNQETSNLLNREEAADYLRISLTELDDIINKDIDNKESLSIYDTYQFIPYANLNGKLIFTKQDLNKWIEYHTGTK